MSTPIETALLDAINASDAPPETLHQDVGKRLGRRSTNVKRSFATYISAGYLDPKTLKPTDALREQLRTIAGTSGDAGTTDISKPAPGETGLVPWNALLPTGLNYRKTFDAERLESLAASILSKGVLTALTVRPNPDREGDYQIAAGERRYRAIGLLIDRGDLPVDTPVPVVCRDMTDAEALSVALAENMEQETVDPFEEAEGFLRLQQRYIEAGRDPGEASGDIAAELGCSQRIVQRRLRTIRELVPAAREAWAEGQIASFAMAEELSRWPEDRQADALGRIEHPYQPLRDAAGLREWLNRAAPPVGEQVFDEDDYAARGGTFVEPEDEHEPRRFANRALAEQLTHDWIVAKAEALASQHGYNPGPVISDYYNDHMWPKPLKIDKVPADQVHAHFVIDEKTFAVKVVHPVTAREDRDAARKAAAAPSGENDEAAPEPVKPYARRCWLQGAEWRTKAVRREIEASPSAAMALTILALLEGNNDGASWNESAPLFINRAQPAGDAAQIGFESGFAMLLSIRPCDGIAFDGPTDHWPVKDREAAMAALMTRDDLPQLFAAMIADLTIDCRYTAQAGSAPALRAIMAGKAQNFALSADSDWLDAYTKDQIIAHAEAAGIGSNIGGDHLPKGELVDRFHSSAPATWYPPEVAFTDRATMNAEVDLMLRREAV